MMNIVLYLYGVLSAMETRFMDTESERTHIFRSKTIVKLPLDTISEYMEILENLSKQVCMKE